MFWTIYSHWAHLNFKKSLYPLFRFRKRTASPGAVEEIMIFSILQAYAKAGCPNCPYGVPKTGGLAGLGLGTQAAAAG